MQLRYLRRDSGDVGDGRPIGFRLATFSAVVVLILTSLLATSRPAYATDCTTEQTIFMRATNGSGEYGTVNEIDNSNRPLESTCSSSTYWPLSWSTAHVRLGDLDGSWAETGWKEEFDAFGSKVWYAFTEWGINYTANGNNQYSIPCTFSFGSASFWYVQTSGSFAWTFSVDCNDGSGVHTLGTYSNTGYGSGLAMGETGRRGGSNTGMADYQNLLRYKNSLGQWVSWGGVQCYSKSPGLNWGPTIITSQIYQIYQGSYSC